MSTYRTVELSVTLDEQGGSLIATWGGFPNAYPVQVGAGTLANWIERSKVLNDFDRQIPRSAARAEAWRDIVAQYKLDPKVAASPNDFRKKLGQDIFAGLFGTIGHRQDIPAEWNRVIPDPSDPPVRVELRLNDHAVATLAQIPFEALSAPPASLEKISDDLVLGERISLVRRIGGTARSVMAPRLSSSLRVLVFAPAPQDQPAALSLDATAEINALRACLGERVTVVGPGQATFARLCERKKGIDIFHFIGHGRQKQAPGNALTAEVLLEDKGGRPDWRDVSEITQVLVAGRGPRVLVLNGCQTAAISVFARQFPAVVGMQYRVSDGAAISFAGGFYQELCRSGQLDDAVWAGRQAIWKSRPSAQTSEHASPVLYLSAEKNGHSRFRFWAWSAAAATVAVAGALLLMKLSAPPAAQPGSPLPASPEVRPRPSTPSTNAETWANRAIPSRPPLPVVAPPHAAITNLDQRGGSRAASVSSLPPTPPSRPVPSEAELVECHQALQAAESARRVGPRGAPTNLLAALARGDALLSTAKGALQQQDHGEAQQKALEASVQYRLAEPAIESFLRFQDARLQWPEGALERFGPVGTPYLNAVANAEHIGADLGAVQKHFTGLTAQLTQLGQQRRIAEQMLQAAREAVPATSRQVPTNLTAALAGLQLQLTEAEDRLKQGQFADSQKASAEVQKQVPALRNLLKATEKFLSDFEQADQHILAIAGTKGRKVVDTVADAERLETHLSAVASLFQQRSQWLGDLVTSGPLIRQITQDLEELRRKQLALKTPLDTPSNVVACLTQAASRAAEARRAAEQSDFQAAATQVREAGALFQSGEPALQAYARFLDEWKKHTAQDLQARSLFLPNLVQQAEHLGEDMLAVQAYFDQQVGGLRAAAPSAAQQIAEAQQAADEKARLAVEAKARLQKGKEVEQIPGVAIAGNGAATARERTKAQDSKAISQTFGDLNIVFESLRVLDKQTILVNLIFQNKGDKNAIGVGVYREASPQEKGLGGFIISGPPPIPLRSTLLGSDGLQLESDGADLTGIRPIRSSPEDLTEILPGAEIKTAFKYHAPGPSNMSPTVPDRVSVVSPSFRLQAEIVMQSIPAGVTVFYSDFGGNTPRGLPPFCKIHNLVLDIPGRGK